MKIHEELERLIECTDNDDIKFILGSIAIEIELGHTSMITSIAHAIADVQDKEVFKPNNINAPRRNVN